MESKVKRALVVEGGGMRSAYVSGALLALQELGPRDFDVVIGTSAGACCAANFLAGKPEYNSYILEEFLASPRFVQYKNVFTKKNIMDVDFLIDECFGTLEELSARLKTMKTKFYITSTDGSTGETIYMDAAKEDIREALRASCAMPYLYRRHVFRNGARMMDGGLTTSIPVQKAIEEGCREIYVICSRPVGYRKKASKFAWVNDIAFSQYPKIAAAMKVRHHAYNHNLKLIETPPSDIKLISVRPQQALPVHRMTRNRLKIRQGVQQGFFDAYQVLTGRPFEFKPD